MAYVPSISLAEARVLGFIVMNPGCFGGHLERNALLTDPEMAQWLELGLIEEGRFGPKNKPGYKITSLGLKAIREAGNQRCPCCGQNLPTPTPTRSPDDAER